MHILFAISVLCFFALMIALVAIVRHLRGRRRLISPEHDFAHHLFAAAEDQNSRAHQTLPQQTLGDILQKKSWNESATMVTVGPDTQPPPSTSPKRI
jgi:hypothetical protein